MIRLFLVPIVQQLKQVKIEDVGAKTEIHMILRSMRDASEQV